MIVEGEKAMAWRAPMVHHDADPFSASWASFVGASWVPSCATQGYPAHTANLFSHALGRCRYVTMDGNVLDGQPRIAGTRIPVRAIVRTLEHYGSIGGVIECYPHLTKEQVADALYFVQSVLELPSGFSKSAPASR